MGPSLRRNHIGIAEQEHLRSRRGLDLRALNALIASWLPIFTLSTPSFAGTIREHPAHGMSIVRCAELDSGVYKGSKPKTDADFAFLKSKHIKYILQLRFLPLLSRAEQKRARRYGISLISVYINASPKSPSEKHVNRILEILHDRCYRPIYFHCDIGRDRSSLIATLYQVYFKGLAPEDAWQKMKGFGFKDSWDLSGLKKYLVKHPTPPASLAVPSHTCAPAR